MSKKCCALHYSVPRKVYQLFLAGFKVFIEFVEGNLDSTLFTKSMLLLVLKNYLYCFADQKRSNKRFLKYFSKGKPIQALYRINLELL